MRFDDPQVLESVIWTMRLADWSRGQNRARINDLANGCPPYSPEEETQNNISINVNYLEVTKLAHDARSSFANAFQKTGNFFNLQTDMGPVHRRSSRGSIVTKEINRVMKRNPLYFECQRSKFALDVLHGIGPSYWPNCQNWCPRPLGVEDVLIPSNTLLTMENLPFFAIFKSYTAEELNRAVHGPKVDPSWNVENCEAAIKWADAEAGKLMGTSWPQFWAPEKMQERLKENGGLYASDAVPTIDCWDVHFYNEESDQAGWRRKICLDAFGQPGVGGFIGDAPATPDKNLIGGRGQLLYDSGDKVYASKLPEIIHWQFADLSAVAPFRYHSVRSLGFLLYAVGHLQNRLRCKFNEAVFENLMMYMRVRSSDELERALKINLISRGIIDETVQFIPPNERWQINEKLAEMGLLHNQSIINENSSSYVQNQNYSNPNVEKTKFQVQAELSATTQLISAALMQAYKYETFEYLEILRRFTIKDSRDPDVREFRVRCLKQGVPDKMLIAEAWDLEPERVMGAGNKTQELDIARQLMQWRPMYDPDAQRDILRSATLAVTDDPGFTALVVPDKQSEVSDAVHDAQLAAGALLAGLPVALKKGGLNHIDYVEAMLASMATVIHRIEQSGGMASQAEIAGLNNMGQHIAQHISLIAQNPEEKQRTTKYQQDLGNLMNLVKAYEQRLQQEMKKQAEENGKPSPEEMAKLQLDAAAAQQKMKTQAEAHGLKQQQKQQSFAADQQRKAQEHQLSMGRQMQETAVDTHATDLETAAEIRNEGALTKAEIAMEHTRTAHEIGREHVKTAHEIKRKDKLAEAQAKNKPKPTSKSE